MLRKYTRKSSFDNMDFEMFVAGEMHIIGNMAVGGERDGRLRLLLKLAHWIFRCRDWPLVRGLYDTCAH